MRHTEALEWERDHHHAFFWGVSGRPCDRAGWLHNLSEEAAIGAGVETASFFADIAKFYENVSHQVLQREALAVGFPPKLLRALLAMYQGERAIIFDGAASAPVTVHGTILAGCSCALSLTKVLLLRTLLRIQTAQPMVYIKNVVDDVSLQGNGPKHTVSHCLGSATVQLVQGLSALRLPLSQKKSAYVTSSTELGRMLESSWSPYIFERKRSVRNLGVDAPGGKRRCTTTRDGRLTEALRRSNRIERLRAAGGKVAGIHAGGPVAQALWGAASVGLPDGSLHRLRAAAARSLGPLPRGSHAGLRLAARFASRAQDPAQRHHFEVVKAWAVAVWEGVPPASMMQAALDGALRRLQLARRPWQKAIGPAAVFALTLKRLSWRALDYRRLQTDTGLVLDLLAVSPTAAANMAVFATRRWSDCQATARAKRGRQGFTIFWDALRPLLRKGHLLGWSDAHRTALVSILTSGDWTQQRLHQAGRHEDQLCRGCFAATGTSHHRRYCCDYSAVKRRQATSQELRDAARQASQDKHLAEWFARGLLPDPVDLLPAPKQSDDLPIQWHRQPPGGFMTGSLFLDGSCKHPRTAALRRAGWAIVQVDDDGKVVAAAYGGVPYDSCPGQTIGDAEDYAVGMLPLVALEPFRLYIDRQGTVDNATVKRHATQEASHPTAHIWSRVWAAFDHLAVTKTKAHASKADVSRGTTTEWQRKGNGHADRFADLGAAEHGLAPNSIHEYKILGSLAYQAARWAGEQHVYLRDRDFPDVAPKDQQVPRPKLSSRPAHGIPASDNRSKETLQSAVRAAVALEPAASSTAMPGSNHKLRVAEVLQDGVHEGQLLFCASCGSCAWSSLKAFRAPCPGRPSPAKRLQLRRIHAGSFPWHKPVGEWRVLGASAPSPSLLDRLVQRMGKAAEVVQHTSNSYAEVQWWQAGHGQSLSRQSILKHYGLTEAQLSGMVRERVAEAARGHRRPRHTEPDFSGSDLSE